MAIGNEPITETLVLVPGQDFVHETSPPSGFTFPAGTSVDLVIYDEAGDVVATWEASVSASVALWDVDKAISDTINIPARFRIYVHYSDGADFCWYAGAVTRQG